MAFHGSSGSSVGRAYIEFVADQDREIDIPQVELTDISLASYMLGKYCCQITMGNRNDARTTHNAATRILRQRSHSSSARLALMSAKLIDYRNRAPISEARAILLRETRQQMAVKITRTGRKGKRAMRAYAQLAEDSALVALSYSPDDRFLAQKALPHHDEGQNGSPPANFDVTATVAGSGMPFTQKFQVKLHCMSWCDNPEPDAEVYQFEARSGYNDDIKLLSGCCDLGMRQLPNSQYDLTLVTDLLAGDTSGSPRISRAAYGLLQVIADGENRRGFIPASAETPLAA